MQVQVLKDYSSSINDFQNWKAGDIISIEDLSIFDHINRDSPETLSLISPASRIEEGSIDRQLKSAKKRKVG